MNFSYELKIKMATKREISKVSVTNGDNTRNLGGPLLLLECSHPTHACCVMLGSWTLMMMMV